MGWRNSAGGYGLTQILLHWTVFAAIAFLIPLGLWMTELDYYDAWYNRGPDLHRSVGVLLGMLIVARVVARLLQVRPTPLTTSRFERVAAHAVHALLYALPLLLVISGYLLSTADGRAIDVFDWFSIPATLQGLERQEDIAGDVHFVLAMVLLALVVVHAAAALRHHIVLKDATLRRMLSPTIAKHEE